MRATLRPSYPRVSQLWSQIRWYETAPEIVLVLGLGLFAATEPHAAGAAFKSNRAVVIMLVVGLGWVLARVVSLVAVRWSVMRLAVFGLAAVGILKVVVVPAYDNHTVIEALPVRSSPPPSVVAPGVPAPTAEPVIIGAGMLRGIDHRASGAVNLYRQADGRQLIGLEDFNIQPGPAYALYVVPGSNRIDHNGGTRLERLRGNRGTQFYDAPDTVELGADPVTVLVWCETFDVPVANATPKPV